MIEIDIANTQDALEIDESLLRKIVDGTLTAEGVDRAVISIAIVDNETIHTLNRRHLNHDYATDVLSFLWESDELPTADPLDIDAYDEDEADQDLADEATPALEAADGNEAQAAPAIEPADLPVAGQTNHAEDADDKGQATTCKSISGEIVVSAEMAVESAEEFGWSHHDEFVLYVVHGLLHLCGYDDLSEAEQQVMRSREQQVLKQWGLTPRYVGISTDSLSGEDV